MEEEILSRIRKWLGNQPMPPYQLEINPTNKCNLACIHCEARGKPRFQEVEENRMTSEILENVIRHAAKLGVKKIHLSGGGEPMASRKAIEVMRFIKNYNIIGSVVTNGTLFTTGLMNELIRISWDNILFSIDGADAVTHDAIRGKNSFKKAIDSIEYFNIHKKNDNKPVMDICMVLNRYNYNQTSKYIMLAHTLKVKKVFIQPIRIKSEPSGYRMALNSVEQNEFNESIPSLLAEASHLNVETNLNEFDENLVKKSNQIKTVIESYMKKKKDIASLPCYSPWYFLGVRPNGDVYPCGVDGEHSYGSILHSTLADVWYGAAFDKLRKQLLQRNLPTFCRACCGMTVLMTKKIQENIS